MERHLEVPECWQYSKLVFWFALVEGTPLHVFGDKWHHVIRIGTAIIGYGMPQADKTITGSPLSWWERLKAPPRFWRYLNQFVVQAAQGSE